VLTCEPEEEESDVGLADTPFLDRPCSPLSSDAVAHIGQLLSHMNINGDGYVSMEEAAAFVNYAFPNAQDVQVFIDVDDLNCRLEMSEFSRSFERLKRYGCSDEEIVATCESIIENGTWKTWRSNRRLLNLRAWEFEMSDGTEAAASCSAVPPACSVGLARPVEVNSHSPFMPTRDAPQCVCSMGPTICSVIRS
jgi:hypothetical protein